MKILMVLLAFVYVLANLPAYEAEDYVEFARDHVEEGNYSKAIEDYRDALENWEENDEYNFEKDDIKYELSKIKEKHTNLLVSEYVKSARDHVEEGNYSKAIEDYRDALENWGENEYNFEKADIKYELSKAKEEYAGLLISGINRAISEEDIETAETRLETLKQVSPENKKITSLEEKLEPLIVKNYLNKGEEELDEWNLSEARNYVNQAESISDNQKIKEIKKKIKEKENIISKIGEKPENSGWDGSVEPVRNYLENRLRDPGSVEYIEWSPVHLAYINNEPVWRVRVKYRAKNAFGGYVVEQKLAYIVNNQVVEIYDF